MIEGLNRAQRIANDFREPCPRVLVGNENAMGLMQEYDACISLGQTLAANFEIHEPLGQAGDTDWVGRGLLSTFGDGWCDSVATPAGLAFTKRSKKDNFSYAMGLAIAGWKTRVSIKRVFSKTR